MEFEAEQREKRVLNDYINALGFYTLAFLNNQFYTVIILPYHHARSNVQKEIIALLSLS
jgi:hypothetical protein